MQDRSLIVNSGGLVGAYWVQRIRDVGNSHRLIEIMGDAGKIKCPIITHQVERALLYPYLRGRDVKKWAGKESCLYLMPQDPELRKCYSEPVMRSRFPKTYEYFLNFKKQLLARKTAPLRQQMSEGPFYPVLGVGPYTFASWKVLFKDLTEFFQCCVVGPKQSSIFDKPLIPDYTLRLVPAESEEEAHYVAALLNSAPSTAALYFSSTGVQTQRYHAGDAERVRVKQFEDSPAQRKLATLSKNCHQAVARNDSQSLLKLERALDELAAEYWGITKSLSG
jgi:hypothetical protein